MIFRKKEIIVNGGFTKTTEDDYKQYKLEKNDIIIARTGNTIGVNCFIEKGYGNQFITMG